MAAGQRSTLAGPANSLVCMVGARSGGCCSAAACGALRALCCTACCAASSPQLAPRNAGAERGRSWAGVPSLPALWPLVTLQLRGREELRQQGQGGGTAAASSSSRDSSLRHHFPSQKKGTTFSSLPRAWPSHLMSGACGPSAAPLSLLDPDARSRRAAPRPLAPCSSTEQQAGRAAPLVGA